MLKKEKLKKLEEMNITEKTCEKCEVEKSVDDFVKILGMVDGYSKFCKNCYHSDIYEKLKIRDKISVLEKECYSCLEIKSIDLFGITAKNLDNHNNNCKECVKIKDKEYRKKRKNDVDVDVEI
jgi:hypothetical protein